ncbi:hypothetical protein EYF80_023013 [Liparis tanakae]|uniref:Uncharacterized protein n=1 Tax=Liparis tanakae TaxID=230148 RepID=A0A4Z2HMK1_9TELE|nr:hypothetical protein EYF80_023013 [Liparis tanakae]
MCTDFLTETSSMSRAYTASRAPSSSTPRSSLISMRVKHGASSHRRCSGPREETWLRVRVVAERVEEPLGSGSARSEAGHGRLYGLGPDVRRGAEELLRSSLEGGGGGAMPPGYWRGRLEEIVFTAPISTRDREKKSRRFHRAAPPSRRTPESPRHV